MLNEFIFSCALCRLDSHLAYILVIRRADRYMLVFSARVGAEDVTVQSLGSCIEGGQREFSFHEALL